MNKALLSSNSNEWETPQDLFEKLNEEFGFTLDAASTHENAKCKKHYTLEDDGLIKNWGGETVFLNPPYGRELPKWVKKAYLESLKGATVVMLIPARTDTEYFHDYILNKAEIRFQRGRIKFSGSKNSAPFPSMIIVYRGVKL